MDLRGVELVSLTYDSDATNPPVAEVHGVDGEVFADTSPDGEVASAEDPKAPGRTKQDPYPHTDGPFALVEGEGFLSLQPHPIDSTRSSVEGDGALDRFLDQGALLAGLVSAVGLAVSRGGR